MFELTNIKEERKALIVAFYRYLLMNNNPQVIKQDILDHHQLDIQNPEVEQMGFDIAEKSPAILEEITSHLKEGWTLNRLPALIQAILLIGVWEIENTNIAKAITIDELVEYTKSFEPDFPFGVVNAILDKIQKPSEKSGEDDEQDSKC